MKYLFSRSLILCASTLVSLFIATQSAWGALSEVHQPGTYTSTYGQTLVSYEGRQYEIYGFSSTGSSENYLWAGTTTTDTKATNCVLKFATTEAADNSAIGYNWVSNAVNGRGNGIKNKTNGEFTLTGMTMNYRSNSSLKIQISGYDQFSIYGKDNGASKYFVVKIDGVEQRTNGDRSTTLSIRRYDITTGQHTIEVTALGDSNNELYGFSLRVPATPSTTYCIDIFNSNNNRREYFTASDNAGEYIIENFVVPDKDGEKWPMCWVGEDDAWNNSYSADWTMENIPLTANNDNKLGLAAGAIGTLHIWPASASTDNNCRLQFTPAGYGLCWGTGNWNKGDYLPFSSTDGVTYTTDLITLTTEQLSTWEYYVGYKTADSYVFSSANSKTKGVNTMGVYNATTKLWWSGDIGTFFAAGQKGKFRMWADNTAENWNCNFIPYYTIVYNANYPAGVSGQPADTYGDYVSLEESRSLTLPDAPTAPTGYVFKGWTAAKDGSGNLLNPGETYDLNQPSANTTLYAQWTPLEYTITYAGLEGASNTSNPATYTIESETITFVAPGARAGYAFAGWSPASIAKGSTGNQTITAQWTPLEYTITYAGLEGATNSGSNPAIYTIESKTITFVAPGARAGYAFAGWSPASIAQGSTGNQTVTAQWKKAHTITFNANGEGATCEPASATCADGESVSLPTPTRDGFTCTGWYDAATGGKLIGAADENYIPTKDITLYAQWEEIVEPTCMDIAAATITNDATSMTASKGIVTVDGGQASNNYLKLSGDAKYIQLTAADGSAPFAAGDVLYVTCYNNSKSPANRGFKIKNTTCTLSIAATSEGVVTHTLTSEDIETDGTIKLTRTSSEDRYKSVRVERCSSTPAQTPTINTHPQPVTATYCAGDAIAELSVAASVDDGGTLSYQWKKNGADIDGATNAAYTPTEAGTYTCVVTNTLDGYTSASTTSKAAEITINPAPSITTQPKSVSVTVSSPAELTVVAKDATAYQWYTCDSNGDNRKEIPDETNNTLTVIPEALGTTYYKVIASNTCGTATSKVVSITATNGPCFEVTKNATTGSIAKGTNTDASSYFNVTAGGKIAFTTTASSRDVTANGVKMDNDNDYFLITLPEGSAFAPNTKISFVVYAGGDNRGLKINGTAITGTRTDGLISGSIILPANFVTTDSIKIYRAGGTVYFQSLTVEGCGNIQVHCAVAPRITLVSGANAQCYKTVVLRAVRSDDGTAYTTGSFQWYKDGALIPDETNDTFTTTEAGIYTVAYIAGGGCEEMSVNSAEVTSTVVKPVVEKKAPHRNYQIKNRGDLRPYTSATHYPLFDVTPKATAEYTSDKWQPSYTIHHAGTVTAGTAPINWLREDASTATTISIGANYEALGSWLKANHPSAVVGDTLMLTMKTINSCDKWDDATADSIPIILTDKYSLAYIVSGNTTTRKFYDITTSDTADPLYTQLRTKYNVTPVSAYATYDYTNYEPYDLLLLTDYPKATGENAQPDYVDALADLVDKKPILSLKAHMSALPKWSAKGFTSNPIVPGDGSEEQAQKTLTVLCFSHDMFTGAEWDNADDRTLTILDNVYKDGNTYKGIQGFLAINSANFVNIATVYDAKGGRNLVACCERQDVTAARFIMLSINQGATQHINTVGQDAIDKLLKYLLWTEATNVSDCSLIFNNAGGDHLWSNHANWDSGKRPTQLQNVRIEANCIVSGNTYGAGNVRIKKGYTLTIAPDGGLASVGKFGVYTGTNYNEPQPITNAGYITVEADANKTGMLMHSHTDQLAATVQMYSPAYYEGTLDNGKPKRVWSYVAIPVQKGTVPQIFNGAYTYLWSEEDGWIRYKDDSTFHAFDGIALSQPSPQTFTFAGNLALAKEYKLTLTNGGSMGGMNLIGNSWTAPIQISKLKTSDFGTGLVATVYIYSTGRDPQSGPATTATQGDTEAGYWTAIPIEAAKGTGWDGPKVIPAMQAFEVNFDADASATSATLTLDYDTIVRASGVDYSTLNQKLYAPGRNSTAEILQPDPSAPAPYEPTMLRIRVADTATCYNVYLIQGARFSEGFDNGWDGFYIGTDGRAPGLCALTTAGEMQVSAQPEIDNTTLVFTPGKSDTYTFSFCLTETEEEPLAAPLYLNDIQLRKSCPIDDNVTYTFRYSENDTENRFVISHIAFEEQDTPTGIANLATVDQQLMLNNPAREALTIRVYDPAGRLCSEMSTREAMLQITLPEPQGVYMIHITGEQTEILQKIVQ